MATEKEKPNEYEGRLRAVKFLLEAFKLERMVYLVICCISIGMLVVLGVMQLAKENPNTTVVISLLLPTGALTYSIGRILKMWNQALMFVAKEQIGEDKP